MVKKEYSYCESEQSKYLWTVLTKDPYCRRGEYCEEIDVRTNRKSPTAAKKLAAQAIKQDYIRGIYPSRVLYRGEFPLLGITFF